MMCGVMLVHFILFYYSHALEKKSKEKPWMKKQKYVGR